MLLPKFLSRKISPEKSLDFWSQKSVLRPALYSILDRPQFEVSVILLTVDIDRILQWV